MNSFPSVTTGYSPNLLIFGRELARPIDRDIMPPPNTRMTVKEQMQKVIKNLECARKVSAFNSERKRKEYKKVVDKRSRAREFEVGDKVFVYIPKAHQGFSKNMTKMWHGPFMIVECIHTLMYRVKNCENGQPMPIPVHAQ